MRIFVEPWQADYGSPYNIDADEPPPGNVEIVEDSGQFTIHPAAGDAERAPVAFVDGVRRAEAWLYQEDPESGALVRGIAGSFCVGAAIAGRARCTLEPATAVRLLAWGSGFSGNLPSTSGGWSWTTVSIADDAPDAPLRAVQNRMRETEARVAESLASQGTLTIVDGPLTFVRTYELPVVGYIKTHHRALLTPADHRRVSALKSGERTSLFRLGEDRFSCYLRIAAPAIDAGPWSGIVRIEIPQVVGIERAVSTAERVCSSLPRFAGVAHADPRAPQNLQPVGGLEAHLRHLLGDSRLAGRAVRESVRALTTTQQEVG